MHFQFQFVNSFLALFYTAFYLQDMDKLKEVGFKTDLKKSSSRFQRLDKSAKKSRHNFHFESVLWPNW